MKLYTFTILMVAIPFSLARSAEEAKAMPVANGEKLAAELNIVIILNVISNCEFRFGIGVVNPQIHPSIDRKYFQQ